jgi:hypothetical protein
MVESFSVNTEKEGFNLRDNLFSTMNNRLNSLERSSVNKEIILPPINMGTPYSYLAETLTDEILDDKTVDDVYAIYDALCASYPQFIQRKQDIGYDESGLPIRLYCLRWQEPWISKQESLFITNFWDDSYDYQKIFINAGTHGNEKSSVYGIALSIKEIVESTEDWAKYLKGNFIIDVVPVLNPYGFNHCQRNGYHVDGLEDNINRDFLTRTRSETNAVYNLLTTNDYTLVFDSHNSGGNSNYYGCNINSRFKKLYTQAMMKLSGLIYESWKDLTDDSTRYPYIQMWVHDSIGTLDDLFNSLNKFGVLMETVGVFASTTGVLTPNHKKYCKFTMEILINTLISFGEYSSSHNLLE